MILHNLPTYTSPQIETHQIGMRLDQYLAEVLPHYSRNQIQDWILSGHVIPKGQEKALLPKYKVKPEDIFVVTIPEAKQLDLTPQPLALDIIFEDEDLIVLNKPKNLVVHPSHGHWEHSLVHGLLHHCQGNLSGINGVMRPGIIHRLDKDTSGLMLIAKNDEAHQKLSEAFASHKMQREYQALVWGVPKPLEGTIKTRIGRDPKHRKKMAVLSGRQGREAITHYQVIKIEAQHNLSLVSCKLETGRTHQIRVHMKHINCPIIGDPLYGKKQLPLLKKSSPNLKSLLVSIKTQALHAKSIGFTHPKTGATMFFESPLNPIMQDVIEQL